MIDHMLPGMLQNSIFVRSHDVNTRTRYMSSLPLSHPCEWGQDFIDDEDTYFLLYNGQAVGAVLFNDEPNLLSTIYRSTILIFVVVGV